ncbi:hypothetical protein [Klebsiella pneumoniae]|uniref:hypothetical protein n=1 Tax=Klebsiella pneumoniae TaxID=573 RepID=UPI001894DB84|nr:hypothetical protein [Klebsiella pneumoniae]
MKDRLLAELLTVHHFWLTPLFYGIWSKKLDGTTTWATTSTWLPEISASGQHAQCGKDYQIMHAWFQALKRLQKQMSRVRNRRLPVWILKFILASAAKEIRI